MKKNEKGFILTETMIVSTVVLSVLIFMFAQFRSLINTYNKTLRYNTVESVYKTNEIKKLLEISNVNNMFDDLDKSGNHYVDVTSCDFKYYNNVTFCKKLYEKLDVKKVLVSNENVSSITTSDVSYFDNGLQKFIDYIQKNYTGMYHRIIVSFNDGTYASLKFIGLSSSYDFSYTGNVQTFTAPISGYYQVELWGAQGGNASTNYVGGKGAYTKGIIYLEKDTNLYVYVGSQGTNDFKLISDTITDATTNFTWNKKYYESSITFNNGTYSTQMDTVYGMAGGGATDIRLVDGYWGNFSSLKSRIMVASGGSGAITYFRTSNGIDGGALVGIDGLKLGTGAGGSIPTGGTQTSGGIKGIGIYTQETTNGGFGIAGQSLYSISSGGSGYYGGGAASHGGSVVGVAASGSSFISGHTGCNAINENSTQDNIIHTNQPVHYSGYKFEYTQMIPGNEKMPNYKGGTMIGNTGNGYARITVISE